MTPNLAYKKTVYKSLSINQRINLKSWFLIDSFWEFINESLILVNIHNNDYYTDNANNK